MNASALCRLEDVNFALRDLAVEANWTKVAVLYTHDHQGPSALHLQHLLLKKNIDCFARKFRHKNVSKMPTNHFLSLSQYTVLYTSRELATLSELPDLFCATV